MTCGSFSKLFQEILRVNRIKSNIIEVIPIKEYGNLEGLILIKNWDFSKKPSFDSKEKEYKWYFSLPQMSMVSTVKAHKAGPDGKTYGDIKDKYGLPGQNVETPSEKAFSNHGIVKVLLPNDLEVQLRGKPYFDPSYGRSYFDENDFEKQVVDGYALPQKDNNGKPLFYEYRVRRSYDGLENIRFHNFGL